MNDPLSPEQRAAIDSMLGPIRERLDRGAKKMDGLTDGLAEMRSELKSNTETTVEVRELLAVGKGGLRVLGWFGAFAKWVAGIAGAVLAVYAVVHAFKTGTPVPPPKP